MPHDPTRTCQVRPPGPRPLRPPFAPFALATFAAASVTLWGCAGTSAGPDSPHPGESPGEGGEVTQGPRIVHAGAPGETGRVLDEGETLAMPQRDVIAPDILFMEYMIEHHLQAVEMAALVAERTTNEQIRLLAGRIDASQEDEIRLMRRWLERHAVPPGEEHEGHEHAGHDHQAHPAHEAGGEPHDMPGMLTEEEMSLLASATGVEFDQLFLELMIMHHEGAILMVEELFSIPGAAQEPELYQFASHVESDQAIEIGRMERMLANLR